MKRNKPSKSFFFGSLVFLTSLTGGGGVDVALTTGLAACFAGACFFPFLPACRFGCFIHTGRLKASFLSFLSFSAFSPFSSFSPFSPFSVFSPVPPSSSLSLMKIHVHINKMLCISVNQRYLININFSTVNLSSNLNRFHTNSSFNRKSTPTLYLFKSYLHSHPSYLLWDMIAWNNLNGPIILTQIKEINNIAQTGSIEIIVFKVARTIVQHLIIYLVSFNVQIILT